MALAAFVITRRGLRAAAYGFLRDASRAEPGHVGGYARQEAVEAELEALRPGRRTIGVHAVFRYPYKVIKTACIAQSLLPGQ